ncbi:MAG: RAMP superfamily protein [Microcoleus sp. PH2017_15_JOR_U_A]|jgi:CRISPR/Cas system CSM-associated protein Csm3 (group 7 of RAMP superfamily)|uniref:RAMP superfamily CRISPR-associated protein n=1 Tax=unclassified Microcoleus TaxID=2642155 RepID=UPI001DFCF6FD|nr:MULTISPECIES: RAMP superfamily CRISPR-associated protein [unclassified Microcoleus]TAG73890.1 MAG: RAMP superfamily protein [Oscillatoriales cyanobacterium]MCC3471925.1 RAMP superfamily protein [Microcoleus sp. PH2017_13_LAR_U_A]MCC3484470.1 RAMP superfamily protein [Microcoleus sp. PH2017_14_LAR_D_A]MCC3497897.1 RAMP superfamily protein [Microcoleus sp. PH2017_15_JOR_U_A]MCC3596627.1 RAMP superfamily protein [Microcoleus sp. PH2017_26_ELK_O_A]
MPIYRLKIKLLSDTTFGRGDGVAGLIDQEVEHDPFGFPYLRGRTLKGLLSEEGDNLIAMLTNHHPSWERVACDLFGTLGSTIGTTGAVHVGDACLPEDLRQAVAFQIKDETLTKTEVLDSLTTIRRQTSIDPQSGTPDEGSLRSFRVVLRDLCFTSDLIFENMPSDEMLSLIAVGSLALRRLGSGRNRGRGYVQCTLHDDANDDDITHRYANYFGQEIKEKVG